MAKKDLLKNSMRSGLETLLTPTVDNPEAEEHIAPAEPPKKKSRWDGTHLIQCHLPDNLYEQLYELRFRTRRNYSDLFQEALIEYLDNHKL